jgi:restriction system protein
VSDLSPYCAELERLVGGQPVVQATTTTDAVQAAAAFALEKHLEDFLIRNWSQTELGKIFDIYQGDEEGEQGGQQFMTDTGPMDILCRSKDKKTLLVIELKKGRASDAVVGQILRYMGYVKEELAEDGQDVRGVIIAAEDDQRIKRALAMVSNVTFYRYEIDFRLVKGVG